MKELSDVALNAARMGGAEYADIRISRHREQGISAREDHIQSVTNAESFGFGVRVLLDGTWGFAASHQVDKDTIAEVTARALAIARANRAARRRPVELAPVDAYVDEVDIGKVKVGQRAVFTVDAFPAMDFEGKVSAIYPKAVIQDNVVNYDVVVDIETSYHGLLRPEMTASVSILLERREDVLAVPAKAVQRERGKNVVYVTADDRTEPREIKAGWRDGQWIEVASGLEEGETVLLASPKQNEEKEQGFP